MKNTNLYFQVKTSSDLAQTPRLRSIGIVSDVMLFSGENRILGFYGLIDRDKNDISTDLDGYSGVDLTVVCGSMRDIEKAFKIWFDQYFQDYKVQFISDNVTISWPYLLIMASNLEYRHTCKLNPDCETCELDHMEECPFPNSGYYAGEYKPVEGIVPIPQDLNDLIAASLGLSIERAFAIDRRLLDSRPLYVGNNDTAFDMALSIADIYLHMNRSLELIRGKYGDS